jgi:AcrR family transcriptional regulator
MTTGDEKTAPRTGDASSGPGLRPPQQRRSRESLERVLRSGETLLAQKGYEGFTVAEVSRRAKVSVGSVYGRFDNKDALVQALHRRMLERMAANGDGPIAADADLGDAVRRGIGALSAGMNRERALLRVFMMRGAVDPAISRPGSEASRAVARWFTDAVLVHRDEIGHPDPEIAADVAFRIAYDVLARNVMHGPTFESSVEVGWDTLTEELGVASLTYLRHGRQTPAASI